MVAVPVDDAQFMVPGLDPLFRPASVAVVGASGRLDNPFARPLRNLRHHGFPGPVYPVNPRYEELEGYRCYPAVTAIGEPIDLALLLVPAAGVLDALRECGEAGVRAAIVFASGFAEVGPDGRAVQDELAAVARSTGIRVVGPNCQGAVYVASRLAATFTAAVNESLPDPTGVAYVGQSGAVGGSILDLARESGMGLTAWVSTGNQADLNLVEIGSYLLEQPDVSVLTAYLEAVPDGRRFAALAARARRAGKHLVVLRSGRSTAGRRAVASHTGAMVGADAAFDVVAREEGVVVTHDVDEMLRAAHALAAYPAAAGRRMAIVTTSGGAGSLAADHCERNGLEVAVLPDDVQAPLAELVPAFGSVVNPVDVTAQLFSRGAGAFLDVCLTVGRSPAVDQLAVVLTMVTGEAAERLAADLVEVARDVGKPVLVAWLAGEEQTKAGRAVYRDAHLPVFRSVRDLAETAAFLAARSDTPAVDGEPSAGPDPATVAPLLSGPLVLEADAGPFLDAVGVPRPRARLVRDQASAVAAARELGGTVVMKVHAAGLLHKTDLGGVRVGVPADDAAAVFDELVAVVGDAADAGVLVQELAAPGLELVVGVIASTEGFPPLVTVGIGGVATEVYRDVTSAPAPVTPERARRMLAELQAAPLLFGHRGRPPADVDAAAEVVARLSAAAVALGDRLLELEVNPLIVAPEGGGVVAADFLARLAGDGRGEDEGER